MIWCDKNEKSHVVVLCGPVHWRDDPIAPTSESFLWDGLALIQRGDEQFVNEPHVRGGNPVASSKGTSYFNDALGTTVGSWEGRASSRPESGLKYSAAALTAFGEDLTVHSPTPTQNSNFFTGKPYVEGFGHAFLMRNYRAGLAKWQTADPMGYPDGWNQLKYGVNSPSAGIDLFGAVWGNSDFVDFYFDQDPNRLNDIDTDQMGLTDAVLSVVRGAATGSIDSLVERYISSDGKTSGSDSREINIPFSVDCGNIVWAMGGGTGRASGMVTYTWGPS